MEFPPIVVDGSVYFVRNNGGTYRLDADTGKVKWKTQIGKLSASSPAYWTGACSSPRCRARSSARRPATASSCGRSSSAAAPSPRRSCARGRLLRHRGRRLYALFARTGRVKWKFKASAAPSRPRRRCPASRSMSATTAAGCTRSGRARARALVDGHLRAPSSASRPGTSTRRPRSRSAACTPATPTARCTRSARGRDARRGAESTGGYVYSSPAVANVPGTRPTVYVGSYDGNLYALDARTGSHALDPRGGGRISGGLR